MSFPLQYWPQYLYQCVQLALWAVVSSGCTWLLMYHCLVVLFALASGFVIFLDLTTVLNQIIVRGFAPIMLLFASGRRSLNNTIVVG